MKIVMYLTLLALITVSCQKELEIDDAISDPDRVTVTLDFTSPEIESVDSRSLSAPEEQAINDINIYLFNTRTNVCTYRYLTNSRLLNIELTSGEYLVYTIANYGSQMESMSQVTLENFTFQIESESDIENGSSLLMSSKKTISIGTNNKFVIQLKRAVAKLDISVSIAGDFNFALHSIQVKNAPKDITLFSDNNPTSLISYSATNSANIDFYMLENLQGDNHSITDEKSKNKTNAPPKATYLSITGSHEGTRVEYSIFLGENNTSSFNINRNKKYIYSIILKGVNDVDSRVNVTTLTATDLNKSYIVGEHATSMIRLTATENIDNSYTMMYSILEGNGRILIDGKEQQPDVEIPFLGVGDRSNAVLLSYTQNSISSTKIRVQARDNDGVTFSKDLVSNFIEEVHKLEINTLTATDSKGGQKSIITYETTKAKYTGAVSVKYELVSGQGTVTYKGVNLVHNSYIPSSLGDTRLEFTPTRLQNAHIKITVKCANNEIVSKNIIVNVRKIKVEARQDVNHTTNRYFFRFFVDGVATDLISANLPPNSCMDIIIDTDVAWKCNSCGRFLTGSSHVHSLRQIIKPNEPLVARGYWLNATSATETVNNCGNPRCGGVSGSVSVHLVVNTGILGIREPNSEFVTFINIPLY